MIAQRLAGAPISWGVCEVPGWGYQLDVDRVLREMCELGLALTEFGPVGFLPAQPRARRPPHVSGSRQSADSSRSCCTNGVTTHSSSSTGLWMH